MLCSQWIKPQHLGSRKKSRKSRFQQTCRSGSHGTSPEGVYYVHPRGLPATQTDPPEQTLKTYRQHHCTRAHRTYLTLAKCMFRRANWVTGEGQYASVSWCRGTSVMLHATKEGAEEAKAFIDQHGCGGMCRKKHEVILLDK